MKSFLSNKCRLCKKVFCCKDCRLLHEEQFHKVNPSCDICIYGKTTLTKISSCATHHVKTSHWPLHCRFCKKVFNSLDEVGSHTKCAMNPEILKMERTPKTPITPINEQEASPMITPFGLPADVLRVGLTPMRVTSTPMPNNVECKFAYKSSLKLMGSASLSDSKKSDRRVTFCETPSAIEPCKTPQCLPLNENNNATESRLNGANESNETSSTEDIFKTPPPFLPSSEEKENISKIEAHNKDPTLWQSALTSLEEHSPKTESAGNMTNHFNVSLAINVFNETVNASLNSDSRDSSLNKSTNIWTSVTNIVKSAMSNISFTAQTSFSKISIKRPQPDNDSIVKAPHCKRMKLTDLKCRRPIRDLSPLYQIRLGRPRCVDKATQTDDHMWM